MGKSPYYPSGALEVREPLGELETPVSEGMLLRKTPEQIQLEASLGSIIIDDDYSEENIKALDSIYSTMTHGQHLFADKVFVVIDDVGDPEKIISHLDKIGASSSIIYRDSKYKPPTTEIHITPQLIRRIELEGLRQRLIDLSGEYQMNPDCSDEIQKVKTRLGELGVTHKHLNN